MAESGPDHHHPQSPAQNATTRVPRCRLDSFISTGPGSAQPADAMHSATPAATYRADVIRAYPRHRGHQASLRRGDRCSCHQSSQSGSQPRDDPVQSRCSNGSHHSSSSMLASHRHSTPPSSTSPPRPEHAGRDRPQCRRRCQREWLIIHRQRPDRSRLRRSTRHRRLTQASSEHFRPEALRGERPSVRGQPHLAHSTTCPTCR
jgi:hypothetical protein